MTDGAPTQREAIATALTEYLHRWAAGEPTRPFATETLAAANALFAATRRPDVSHDVVVHTLGVESVDGDIAIASLSATYIRRREARSNETPVSGPVHLHLEDGTWRVALLYQRGWPVAPILLEGKQAKTGPITIRARAVDFRASGTAIALETHNASDREAWYKGVDVPTHDFVVEGGGDVPSSVLRGPLPPGVTVFREAIIPPLVTDRDRLEIRVTLEHGRRRRRTTVSVLPSSA